MSFPVGDERGWGRFGSCALFVSDGRFPAINICVCIYMRVCVNQNTSLWCCLAGGVAPLWGEPWGCSVLQMLRTASLAAQQHSRVYLRSYSPSWHACIQAGVYYFIAACFRAGLGSRVSAWGFPCLWTALEVFVVQVLLPGGSSHMVALDWVPQGKVLLESSPRGFGCPVV